MGLWQLAAGVVAIRHALDISTGQAIVTGLVAMIVVIAISAFIALTLGIAFFGAAMMLGMTS